MFKYILAESGVATGGTISLLIFFGLFIAILLWVFRKGSKEKYKKMSQMPLDSDNHSPHSN